MSEMKVVNPAHFTVSKELFERLSAHGRFVVHHGGSIGIPVDLAVIKALDASVLKASGLQMMLVPIER